MNKKRIAALIAASTMLLSAVTANATQISTASGTQTVSGSGTVDSYNHEPIFEVTLPTANALDFTVDPYGLTDIANGEAVDLDNLPNTGKIFHTTGAGALIANASSVPVTVTIKAHVTDDGSVVLASSQAAVATGSTTSMFLALVPSADKVTVVSGEATNYSPAAKSIGITKKNSEGDDTAAFYLAKATYEVLNTGGGFTVQKKNVADNYDATSFKIGGYANYEADWSDYAGGGKTLGLSAVFAFAEAADGDEDTDEDVYGLVVSPAATTLVEFEAPSSGPTLSGTGVAKSSDGGIDYDVTFTKGTPVTLTLANATATTATIGDAANAITTAIPSGWITVSGTTVTINASAWSGAPANSSKYIKINLADDAGSIIVKVTVKTS